MFLLWPLAVCSLAGTIRAAVTAQNESMDRDVIIIGGGAAGIYAATLLRSMGRSFAVIEKKPQFGGDTQTFTIPGTNVTLDYGVQGYTPLVNGSYGVVEDFFATYNVPISFIHRSETSSQTTRYFDFRTTKELANFTVNSDLDSYTAQADKYPWLGYQTRTPTPIPGDLTLPFQDFVEKYSLQSSVYNIYYNVEGLGDVLSLPTYYVLRELNAAHLLALSPSSPGLVATTDGFNQEAYLRAQAQFGIDALVNSTVQSAQRDENGVELMVLTSSGQLTIKAPRLLVAMPPILANMEPLGLDSTESELFSKFVCSGWYAGLLNVTGLKPGEGFQNAGYDTLYNLPPLPAVYQISPTRVSSVYLVRFGSVEYMPEDEVQAEIISTVEQIRTAVVPNATYLSPVRILTFASHCFDLHVTADDLTAGFNNQLDGLQGHLSTWYSGATFTGASSTDIWNFTHGVVEDLLVV